MVVNGNFDANSISPWTAALARGDDNSSFGVVDDASSTNGNRYFLAQVQPNTMVTLTQDLGTVAAGDYNISVDYLFGGVALGSTLYVYLNQDLLFQIDGDGSTSSGQWNTLTKTYTNTQTQQRSFYIAMVTTGQSQAFFIDNAKMFANAASNLLCRRQIYTSPAGDLAAQNPTSLQGCHDLCINDLSCKSYVLSVYQDQNSPSICYTFPHNTQYYVNPNPSYNSGFLSWDRDCIISNDPSVRDVTTYPATPASLGFINGQNVAY